MLHPVHRSTSPRFSFVQPPTLPMEWCNKLPTYVVTRQLFLPTCFCSLCLFTLSLAVAVLQYKYRVILPPLFFLPVHADTFWRSLLLRSRSCPGLNIAAKFSAFVVVAIESVRGSSTPWLCSKRQAFRQCPCPTAQARCH